MNSDTESSLIVFFSSSPTRCKPQFPRVGSPHHFLLTVFITINTDTILVQEPSLRSRRYSVPTTIVSSKRVVCSRCRDKTRDKDIKSELEQRGREGFCDTWWVRGKLFKEKKNELIGLSYKEKFWFGSGYVCGGGLSLS